MGERKIRGQGGIYLMKKLIITAGHPLNKAGEFARTTTQKTNQCLKPTYYLF